MIKTLSLCVGIAGAIAASQYPAFTQQYIQRLGGQVDALTQVVLDFDSSALEAGLGREEALQQMTGTAFLESRQTDMRTTFARHISLSDHLKALKAATPLQRMVMPHRIADPETFSATWDDFSPAMPVTRAGAMSAGIGGFLGYISAVSLMSSIAGLFRRKPRRSPLPRSEPLVARPNGPSNATKNPRLLGETR